MLSRRLRRSSRAAFESGRHLEAYTKADANAFRDALIERGLAGSSITRIFGTVRAVVNFAISEQGQSLQNPFNGVYYDRSAGVSDRHPIPPEGLLAVQNVQSRDSSFARSSGTSRLGLWPMGC